MSLSLSLSLSVCIKGGLVKAGLDVAQIWLEGTETLVNTIDREGNMLPINMINGHAITRDPLVVLVSSSSFTSPRVSNINSQLNPSFFIQR